jgi:hypothetical protein
MLLPGQFSVLQLVVTQSQTLPLLNQHCLMRQVMAAGPEQATELGTPKNWRGSKLLILLKNMTDLKQIKKDSGFITLETKY